jgi:hypothetical protein
MTNKTIGQNTGPSSHVNWSGPELSKFSADVRDSIKFDIAESKNLGHAIIDNSDHGEFVIVSKPTDSAKEENE